MAAMALKWLEFKLQLDGVVDVSSHLLEFKL
jgi:hypothetical protein